MSAIRFAPLALAACVTSGSDVAVAQGPGPIFPNSVASNDIDFITPNDPSTFQSVTFEGQSRQEMPSKLRNGLFLDDTFVFSALFSDGAIVPIWLDPAIGDQTTVAQLAETIAVRVGQLPGTMRAPLDHVVVNAGDHAAQEEADGGFFMLYADNVQTRLDNHDLSETVFHEAAHVSLQKLWLRTAEWQAAVAADPGVITDYARTNAAEDFAESALFAYTYNRYPDRLPPEVRAAVEATIPNRTALFQKIIVD